MSSCGSGNRPPTLNTTHPGDFVVSSPDPQLGSLQLVRLPEVRCDIVGSGGDALLDTAQPAKTCSAIEEAYDTELLDVAMQDVRKRVKPHTWRAFEMSPSSEPGSEAAEELGI